MSAPSRAAGTPRAGTGLPAQRARARKKLSFATLTHVAVEVALGGGIGAGIGALVGIAAGVFEWGKIVWPLIPIGSLTGLLVGVLAIFTGREVLPRVLGYPLPVRLLAMLVTLLAGAAFATSIGFWMGYKYAVNTMRGVVLVLGVNVLIAVISGIIVFLYEDLARRLSRTREQLALERIEQAHARERAARAELQALQARINPHFFFNALNTAAAFVSEDPSRAERLLERFAGLFRYAFRRGGEPFVTIHEELEFIRAFLDIEEARFGDRVKTTVELDPAVAEDRVPPLVLQPLVENAVLHGRDPDTGTGRIVVRALRDESGTTILEVLDDGPGPGEARNAFPSGHALENIAARVAASRGGRLEIRARREGGTCARLVFPPHDDGANERDDGRSA